MDSRYYSELESKLHKYYRHKHLDANLSRQKECDIVSSRIAGLLDIEGFTLSLISLQTIHKKLFDKAFPYYLKDCVGVFRKVNIEKKAY